MNDSGEQLALAEALYLEIKALASLLADLSPVEGLGDTQRQDVVERCEFSLSQLRGSHDYAQKSEDFRRLIAFTQQAMAVETPSEIAV